MINWANSCYTFNDSYSHYLFLLEQDVRNFVKEDESGEQEKKNKVENPFLDFEQLNHEKQNEIRTIAKNIKLLKFIIKIGVYWFINKERLIDSFLPMVRYQYIN